MQNLIRWIATLVLAPTVVAFAAPDRRSTEGQPAKEKPLPESTRRMARLLRDLAAEFDVSQAPVVVNNRRVQSIRQQLADATNAKAKLNLEYQLAGELLTAGENLETLAQFDRLERLAKELQISWTAAEVQAIRMGRIQAHMRCGEAENCCAEHNPDSCLVPLQGAAIYRHQEGSRRAIELLNEQLADAPDDLTARWLLNIAHMTIGEYPDKVPRQWLIPPSNFASDYDIKRFPEIAVTAGLDTYGLSGGCIADDFDGDGLLDIVRSDTAFDGQLRFFHNNGDTTFADRTKEAGLLGEVGGLNITSADYDNDGFLDILVLRGGWLGKPSRFPKSLLRNNGDGTFTDMTDRAGLMIAHPTQTAVWFDYDGDGWLDLFVGNETLDSDDPHPCELFHNNQDGTFTECAAASGIRVLAFVKGVASADYNNDGRPDLYISQRGDRRPTSNILLRNDGPRDPSDPKLGWRFTNVTQAAGLAKTAITFPCFFFDYDNDGWEDIFVCGFFGGVPATVKDALSQPNTTAEAIRLYRNNGDGTFADIAPALGLAKTVPGMAANYGDLDNDGFLDVYIGTGEPSFAALFPNMMFRNAAGKKFQNVTASGGFGNLQKGHGIAFADVNNDGQQDIYEVMGGAFSGDKYYSVLYANPGHDNHWVTLKLEGRESNRSAVGARLRLYLATAAGEQVIHRTVSTGGSFGCSPLQQQIGLGAAASIKRIEIFWPATGKVQRLAGVPMDRFYKIKEGESAAVPWKIPRFEFRIPASTKAATTEAPRGAAPKR